MTKVCPVSLSLQISQVQCFHCSGREVCRIGLSNSSALENIVEGGGSGCPAMKAAISFDAERYVPRETVKAGSKTFSAHFVGSVESRTYIGVLDPRRRHCGRSL